MGKPNPRYCKLTTIGIPNTVSVKRRGEVAPPTPALCGCFLCECGLLSQTVRSLEAALYFLHVTYTS